MNRLFIALPIDEAIIQNLLPVHDVLGSFADVVKVVEPSQYHLTLKFIGECEGSIARAIEHEFPQLSLPITRFDYTVKDIGMFPNIKHPAVIWTGIHTDERALSQMVTSTQIFAKKFGIKEEVRSFVPHLTLARIRKGRKLTEKINDTLQPFTSMEFGSATFNRIVLFSSKLTPQGPVYTPLQEIRL